MIRSTVVIIFIFFTAAVCNKKQVAACYKGKLLIKGICMNYVIQVLDGKGGTLNKENEWVDETTGTSYQNVFALEDKCSFPDLEEGAEFYFTVQPHAASGDCAVCEAFRPVPAARNNITVLQSPCR